MSELTLEEIGIKLEKIALPILDEANIEFVELRLAGHPKDVIIEFLADTPTGGITIVQLTAMNKAIGEAIDADGFLGENYSLEFSSPGLDRPLVTGQDFLRNVKRSVQVEISDAVEGKKGWTGKIVGVADNTVELLAKKNKAIKIPLAIIVRAVLVI